MGKLCENVSKHLRKTESSLDRRIFLAITFFHVFFALVFVSNAAIYFYFVWQAGCVAGSLFNISRLKLSIHFSAQFAPFADDAAGGKRSSNILTDFKRRENRMRKNGIIFGEHVNAAFILFISLPPYQSLSLVLYAIRCECVILLRQCFYFKKK